MKQAILLSLAAAAALATAAPALAQGYDQPPPYGQPNGYGAPPAPPTQYGQPELSHWRSDPGRFSRDVNDRIGFLFGRISESQSQGQIGYWQARHLRGELGQVRWMAQRYRWQNGGSLNDWQRFQLNQRLDGVAAQLRGDRW